MAVEVFDGCVTAAGGWRLGQRDGTWWHWDVDGHLVQVSEWSGGAKVRAINLRDGAVRSEIQLRDGTPHGDYFVYNDTGVLRSRGTYCHGRRCGDWAQYGRRGELVCAIDLGAEGNGEFEFCDEAGRVRVRGTIEDGIPVGEWTWYDEHELVVQQCTYKPYREKTTCDVEAEARLPLP